MRSLAVLSMHTSPLAQPGQGDGGGMNVYVRELCAALARSGTECDVFTRAWSADLPAVLGVEPGLRVHHVQAGPLAPLPKEALPGLVDEFAARVEERLREGPWGKTDTPAQAIHANYWLSGVAGHRLKHRLGIPLLSTFHTLARVKTAAGDPEAEDRAAAEAATVGCSDVVFASDATETDQLVDLYGAKPERVVSLAPGVDHAFFSPGDQGAARRAVGLPEGVPLLLFLGRIQPLKGADVAIGALAALPERWGRALLAVVGGPSGPDGQAEMARVRALAAGLGVADRVRFFPPQPHELVSTFCRAADVCLVPSRSESFGLVALEAAACGVPVVATAVGGLRTVVVDGVTGALVSERTSAAFAAAAARVLDDPRPLGEAAAAWASRFTWSAAAADLRRAHAEVCGTLVECA